MKIEQAASVVTCMVVLAWSADANARNCKKGIPCGNSCISANKVCHVGSSYLAPSTSNDLAPRTTTGGGTAGGSASDQSLNVVRPDIPKSPSGLTASTPSVGVTWVGSISDHIYFRLGCTAANDLATANRRVFKNEDEALLAGYRHSAVIGC